VKRVLIFEAGHKSNLVNDVITEIFRTRVRLPTPPPNTRKNMSEETKNEKTIKPGPPWKNIRTFNVYDEALALKLQFLEEKPDHQAKIKRLSSGFVVKTRLHPDLQPKKETKNGKNRKSRKRNTDKGKTEIS